MKFQPLALIVGLLLAVVASAAPATQPVSFSRDIRPILATNCNSCHKPDKMKADLDMTTFATLMIGGKHGKTIVPRNPDDSRLVDMISGDDPEMPKDNDSLKPDEVALIARWVREGAIDDTPLPGTAKIDPPIYNVSPAITSMAFSPDGSLLAVAGYHEVLLHKSDGSGLVGRLIGDCARIESLAFSKDGKYLAVAGGSPAEFGQVQVWDVATRRPYRTFQPSTDSLFGVSFSPDGKSVACGAADKIVRRINVEDGKVLMEFKAHADWVLATTFSSDGKQLVSGGRDKALKLIDVESGRFVDDINNPLEQVLCMARHPTEDKIIYGGDLGTARIYRISDNQGRTAGRNDTNLLATFERQRGPVYAVAFSPTGDRVALASAGEVRVYDAGNTEPVKPVSMKRKGARAAQQPVVVQSNAQLILSAHAGAIFAVAWKPDGSVIATAGADGMVRFFDAKTGAPVKEFVPVPITPD